MSKELTPMLHRALLEIDEHGKSYLKLSRTLNEMAGMEIAQRYYPGIDPLDLPWTEEEVKAMGWNKEYYREWPDFTVIKHPKYGITTYKSSTHDGRNVRGYKWLSWPTRRVWQAMQEGGQDAK